jgi:hypothetical protein
MSILSKAVPATEMKPDRDSYWAKVLLLGASKGGKTTSACTMPGKKLLVDMDRRKASALGLPDVDILDLGDPTDSKTWNSAQLLKTELWSKARSGNFPYDCVIFDGVTALNRICMNYVLTLKKADGSKAGMGFGGVGPAEHHYPPQMHLIIQYITSTLALPCHVVYTGHYDLFEEKGIGTSGLPTKTLHYWPKIYGKTRTEIATWFDESYECYAEGQRKGKGKYYWRTIGSGSMDFLGSSLNQGGKYWESPFEVNLDDSLCGFAKLFELRFGKEEKEKDSPEPVQNLDKESTTTIKTKE